MNRKSTDFQRIVQDLARLGVCQNDILLVHSSLSSLGNVEGGARTVVDALKDAVGPSGTLMMPALSYTTVNAENTIFSVKETPCCVGAIPEYFRKMPDTLRSLHPTHSVCASGALSKELLCGHWMDNTPVGSHSPFAMVARHKGKILMLGCGLCPNTSMHGIEELTCPPYLLEKGKTLFTVIDAKKNKRRQGYYCHDFKGFIQRYDRVSEILSSDELKQGTVLKANCFLIDAAVLWEKANQKLKKQPFAFVERLSD